MISREPLEEFIKKMKLSSDYELMLTGISSDSAEALCDKFEEVTIYDPDKLDETYSMSIWFNPDNGWIIGTSLDTSNISDRKSDAEIVVHFLSGSPEEQYRTCLRICNELQGGHLEEGEGEEENWIIEDLKHWPEGQVENSSGFPTERSPEQWDDSTAPTIFDTKDLEDQLP